VDDDTGLHRASCPCQSFEGSFEKLNYLSFTVQKNKGIILSEKLTLQSILHMLQSGSLLGEFPVIQAP